MLRIRLSIFCGLVTYRPRTCCAMWIHV